MSTWPTWTTVGYLIPIVVGSVAGVLSILCIMGWSSFILREQKVRAILSVSAVQLLALIALSPMQSVVRYALLAITLSVGVWGQIPRLRKLSRYFSHYAECDAVIGRIIAWI